MATFDHPATTICVCGELLGACDDVANHGEAPKAGDITICVYCGAVLEFDQGGIARLASDAVITEFRAMEVYPAAVSAVHAYRNIHGVTNQLRHDL